MTPEQQETFRAFLAEHLILCPRARLLSLREYIQEVLGVPVIHWRSISPADARKVMREAAKLKPKRKAA